MIHGTIKAIVSGIIVLALVALGWRTLNVVENVFGGPSKVTEVGPAILRQIKQTNKQIFVEHYSYVRLDHTEAPSGVLKFLGGIGIKQAFVMYIHGIVPAGIDLSQFGPEHIRVSNDGQRVEVTLPPPQIFEANVTIDMQNTEIVSSSDFCPNFLCPNDRFEAYKNELEPRAREKLIAGAKEAGILSQVAKEAEAYYSSLLNGLGIAEVKIVISDHAATGTQP